MSMNSTSFKEKIVRFVAKVIGYKLPYPISSNEPFFYVPKQYEMVVLTSDAYIAPDTPKEHIPEIESRMKKGLAEEVANSVFISLDKEEGTQFGTRYTATIKIVAPKSEEEI